MAKLYERTVYLSTQQIQKLRTCKPIVISRQGKTLILANKKAKKKAVTVQQKKKIKARIQALKAQLV